MFEQGSVTKPQPSVEALSDLRQALELYGAAHARCERAQGADEQNLRGLLRLAEEALTASAGRYSRLEDGVVAA